MYGKSGYYFKRHRANGSVLWDIPIARLRFPVISYQLTVNSYQLTVNS